MTPPLSPTGETTPSIYKAANNTGPYGIFGQFLGWSDNRKQYFNERDSYGQTMLKHPAVEQARASLFSKLALACRFGSPLTEKIPVSYTAGGGRLWSAALDLVSSVTGFVSFGLIGKKPEYGVIGSLGSKSYLDIKEIDCTKGTANIEYHLNNVMGSASATRYSYSSQDSTILSNNPFGENAVLSNTEQYWDLKETLDFSEGLKK